MSEFAEDYEQKARLLAELRRVEAELASLRVENAQLRDRLGRAAYAVRAHASAQAWEALTEGERAYWCDVGQAVADSLTIENAALRAQNKSFSLMIGEQNTTIGYQDAMLARFEAELSRLNERQFAAFTMIGRLDYFLETYTSQPATARGKQAAQLRREIAELTEATSA